MDSNHNIYALNIALEIIPVGFLFGLVFHVRLAVGEFSMYGVQCERIFSGTGLTNAVV